MSDRENEDRKGGNRENEDPKKGNKDGRKNADDKNQESDSDYQAITVQRQQKHLNAKKEANRETQSARSRSASRRARRNRIQKAIDDGKYMKTASLEALEEADASGELSQMQMFERIGPDSTSMDGPVTKARAERGEIPMRGTDPNQPYRKPEKKMSELEDQDGLKLTLEANLDVEIELKASIRGDLTLSLFGEMLPDIELPRLSLPNLGLFQ